VNRILLVAGLIYLSILVGFATLSGGVLVLAIPLLLYLGLGLLYGPQKLELEVKRSVSPQRAQPGAIIDVHLTITNLGSPLEELLLEDQIPHGLDLIEGDPRVLTCLASQEKVEIVYSVRGNRGVYRFNDVRASANDPFRIFRQTRVFKSPGRTFILPEFPRLKTVAIRPRHTRVYSGSIPARQGGSGVEFFGVRQYQSGDPRRHINWKVSARHVEALFSNEFEVERVADVWLILDARIRSDIRIQQGSLFEHTVTAAAALAQALLLQGNRVGLLTYGGFLDWTFPGYGRIQREHILRALTRAHPGESLVFDRLENLPTRVFPLHSQLMLISPLHPEDQSILIHLRARGYQVIVISPDPVAFENNELATQKHGELGLRLARMERDVLMRQLRHAGVLIFNWDVSIPFDRAMRVSLSRLLPWLHSIGDRR
jgi:uncharacterized protein (DUF58 family)